MIRKTQKWVLIYKNDAMMIHENDVKSEVKWIISEKKCNTTLEERLMTRDQFIALMDSHVKLIRSEARLTQEKMAVVLGLSKKTLVEIEKGRSSLGWSGSVACASLFAHSPVLTNAIGTDVGALMVAIAFSQTPLEYPKTLGGKVWWKSIREEQGYRLQQNLISHHFRLLDSKNRRRAASFDLSEIDEVLMSILQASEDIPKED